MASPFTVITASIPERWELLQDARASVAAQTHQPDTHLIRINEPGKSFGYKHLGEQRNILLGAVTTEWVATLDDDDLLDPDYLETISQHVNGADVVYGWCRGRTHRRSSWDPALLRKENYICGVACVRTEAALSVGGWPADGRQEDWFMWQKLLDVGARFVCVERELWTHRSGDWLTITPA